MSSKTGNPFVAISNIDEVAAYKQGLDVEFISRITNLSLEEIREILTR